VSIGKSFTFKLVHRLTCFVFDRERISNTPEIHLNIHETIQELCKNVHKLGLEFDSETNRQYAKIILAMGSLAFDFFTRDYVERVKTLWKDSGVQQCFRRANEFQLIDSAK
jgi:hypothetical protein